MGSRSSSQCRRLEARAVAAAAATVAELPSWLIQIYVPGTGSSGICGLHAQPGLAGFLFDRVLAGVSGAPRVRK